jgi:hypothetical protein
VRWFFKPAILQKSIIEDERAIIVTKQATIAGLNQKIHVMTNAVSRQMSTMRGQFSQMLGISHNGKRDIYEVYGYPRSLSGTRGFEFMYRYSRRMGIAHRIVYGMPKSCWRDGFQVFTEDNEGIDVEILEEQIKDLNRAGFLKKIESADALNRIGRMSVLFVGVPDGKESFEEVGPVIRGKDFLDKIYFSPYAYDGIEILQQEDDPKNSRFGLPKIYQLQRIPRDGDEKDTQVTSIRAHWSRVIHLNENALDSDIEGMGSLEPVMNRILDIDKATGGASEAYFRNAKGKIAYEVDKEFAAGLLSDPVQKQKFQDGAEDYTNNFQDHTVAAGAKVKTLPTDHHSPLDTVKVALWEISGYTGEPIRVLTGEGSGQLAGSEDQLARNQVINDRQFTFCVGRVERLFEILESAQMLELPENYEIKFPVQEAATDKERIENGNKKADTILKITQAKTQPGGDDLDTEKALQACGVDDVIDEDFEPSTDEPEE